VYDATREDILQSIANGWKAWSFLDKLGLCSMEIEETRDGPCSADSIIFSLAWPRDQENPNKAICADASTMLMPVNYEHSREAVD